MMSRARFCWIYGVLGWGVSSALLFAFLLSRRSDSGFLTWLAISLGLFPAAGYLWGRVMWGHLHAARSDTEAGSPAQKMPGRSGS